MANDRQILDEKLIAMLGNEAMARKLRGTSKPFNARGCRLAVDSWRKGAYSSYTSLYYPPVLNNT